MNNKIKTCCTLFENLHDQKGVNYSTDIDNWQIKNGDLLISVKYCPFCGRHLPPPKPQNNENPKIEAFEDLLSDLYLYINWKYVTRPLTTEQKNLLADSIDNAYIREENDDGDRVERWWE